MFEFEGLKFLYVFLPAFMRVLFLLLIVLLIYNRKVIWNSFRGINKKTWLMIFLIVFVAFLLRFFWIPHEHKAGYDGFNWVSQALSIQEHNVYSLCEFKSSQSCYEHAFHAWPPMYHVLLGTVFNIFGGSESVAFHFNAFLGTISVFFAFLLSYLWTKKEDVSLVSAFVFGMLPIFLKFSGGVVLEIASVLFLILTLILFEIFMKEKREGVFFLFLISLLCGVYIRAENIFWIPFFLLFLGIRSDIGFFWDKKNRNFFLISLLCLFLLSVPALFLIYIGKNEISYEGWNPTIIETINYFLTHSPKNLYFFINYQINPFLFISFGMLGTIFAFIKEKRLFLFFLLFLLFYFALYSGYDQGVFEGWMERRSLILYVPLLYFFVKGVFILLNNTSEKFKKPVTFVFVAIFIASLIPTVTYIFKEHHPKIITDILIVSENKIPKDAYFLSRSSAIIRSTVKRNVIALYAFEDQKKYFANKEIFLLKDIWWWAADNHQLRRFIHENYNLEPIERVVFKNTHEYGIYRLIKK